MGKLLVCWMDFSQKYYLWCICRRSRYCTFKVLSSKRHSKLLAHGHHHVCRQENVVLHHVLHQMQPGHLYMKWHTLAVIKTNFGHHHLLGNQYSKKI